MSARVYPADLPNKAKGLRYQGWCFEHQDGVNAKTRKRAQKWCDDHNMKEHSE